MSEVSQVQEDLHYVRQAVERSDSARHGYGAVYYVWAAYTLIGYMLIDLAPHWANWYFSVAWIPAGTISGFLHSRFVRHHGEFDPELRTRMILHWLGGAILSVGAPIVLANMGIVNAQHAGQICVICFGIVYYMAGVHFDRSFLWLGPALVVGGLSVGYIPYLPWTALGVLIAVGLCAASIMNQRALNRSISQAA